MDVSAFEAAPDDEQGQQNVCDRLPDKAQDAVHVIALLLDHPVAVFGLQILTIVCLAAAWCLMLGWIFAYSLLTQLLHVTASFLRECYEEQSPGDVAYGDAAEDRRGPSDEQTPKDETNDIRQRPTGQQENEMHVSQDELDSFEQHLNSSKSTLHAGGSFKFSFQCDAASNPFDKADTEGVSKGNKGSPQPRSAGVETIETMVMDAPLAQPTQHLAQECSNLEQNECAPTAQPGQTPMPNGLYSSARSPPTPFLSKQEKREQEMVAEQKAWVKKMKTNVPSQPPPGPPRKRPHLSKAPGNNATSRSPPQQATASLPGWGTTDALAAAAEFAATATRGGSRRARVGPSMPPGKARKPPPTMLHQRAASKPMSFTNSPPNQQHAGMLTSLPPHLRKKMEARAQRERSEVNSVQPTNIKKAEPSTESATTQPNSSLKRTTDGVVHEKRPSGEDYKENVPPSEGEPLNGIKDQCRSDIQDSSQLTVLPMHLAFDMPVGKSPEKIAGYRGPPYVAADIKLEQSPPVGLTAARAMSADALKSFNTSATSVAPHAPRLASNDGPINASNAGDGPTRLDVQCQRCGRWTWSFNQEGLWICKCCQTVDDRIDEAKSIISAGPGTTLSKKSGRIAPKSNEVLQQTRYANVANHNPTNMVPGIQVGKPKITTEHTLGANTTSAAMLEPSIDDQEIRSAYRSSREDVLVADSDYVEATVQHDRSDPGSISPKVLFPRRSSEKIEIIKQMVGVLNKEANRHRDEEISVRLSTDHNGLGTMDVVHVPKGPAQRERSFGYQHPDLVDLDFSTAPAATKPQSDVNIIAPPGLSQAEHHNQNVFDALLSQPDSEGDGGRATAGGVGYFTGNLQTEPVECRPLSPNLGAMQDTADNSSYRLIDDCRRPETDQEAENANRIETVGRKISGEQSVSQTVTAEADSYSKATMKKKRQASRGALREAWIQREKIRKRLLATWTLDGARALEEVNKTCNEKRSELANCMGKGDLNAEDGEMFPVLSKADVSPPKFRLPSDSGRSEVRKGEINDDSTSPNKVEIEKLQRKALNARDLYEEAYAYFDRPPRQGRTCTRDLRAQGEARIDRATNFYAQKRKEVENAYDGLVPDWLRKELWTYDDKAERKKRRAWFRQ